MTGPVSSKRGDHVMYLRHFGLASQPFALTPDPARLYASHCHSEALAALQVGLLERRGFIVMIGEVGTGKTTLLYRLLTDLGPDVHTAFVANTMRSYESILRSILEDLRVDYDDADEHSLLTSLNAFLLGCYEKGQVVAVVIDEAQDLSDEAFEQLRLLSNFETYDQKLLQVILVGQPELDEKLSRPGLRQVAERVAVRCNLGRLDKRASRAYIEHRLQTGGGSAELFTPAALRLAVRRSDGIPRRMNIACHNALLLAFARDVPRVDLPVMRAALSDLGVSRSQQAPVRGGEALGDDRAGEYEEPRHVGRSRSQRLARTLATAAVVVAGAALAFSAYLPTSGAEREATGSGAAAAPSVAAPVAAVAHPVVRRAERESEALVAVAQTQPGSGGARQPAAARVARAATAAARSAPVQSTSTPRGTQVAKAVAGGAANEPMPVIRLDAARALEPAPAPRPSEVRPRKAGTAGERTVTIRAGENLYRVILSAYGGYTPELVDRVMRANPNISAPERVAVGTVLRLPAPAAADGASLRGPNE